MGKAVKSVTKVIAKAAPYLGLAYGGYTLAGGGSLFGGMGGVGKALSAANYTGRFTPLVMAQTAQPGLSLGATLSAAASKVGNYIAANPFQSAGMALQGIGYVQQRKAVSAQKEALDASARAEIENQKQQQRYQETLARRRNLDIMRQNRIMSGQYQASAAGAGLGFGTSGYLGAVSSAGTQARTNVGDNMFALGASEAASNTAQLAAGYQSDYYGAKGDESKWSQVTSLGGSLYDGDKARESLFNLGKSIFSIET